MEKIKWLHLSDIHYTYNGYKTTWLRTKLLDVLKGFNDIDILVITGDLLYQFKGEYSEVKSYISQIVDAIGMPLSNVVIVPGNHDIKRGNMRTTLVDGIIQNGREDLDSEMIEILLRGESDFIQFHNEFLKTDSEWRNVHFIKEMEKCNVINLNTCLLCGSETFNNINTEEGKLSIVLSKLIDVLESVKNSNKINIAVGHHSLECFNKKERTEIVQLFNDYNIDLYLCGHMHISKMEIHKNGGRNIPCFVCGANMSDNYADVTFMAGEINLNNYQCNVKCYEWGRNNEWIESNDIIRGMSNENTMKFDLERLQEANQEISIGDDLLEKEIEMFTNVSLEESDFEKFIMNFCKIIKESSYDIDNKKELDVEDKFEKMKCSQTFQREFDANVGYFTVIDNIFSETAYISYDKKFLIPGIISSAYNRAFRTCKDGNEILYEMVDLLIKEYGENIYIHKYDLEQYFKTVIFWSINKCTIYNEIK